MPKHSDPLRRILQGISRGRTPLAGVEVRDSTWDEWTEAVSEFAPMDAADAEAQLDEAQATLRRNLADLLSGRG